MIASPKRSASVLLALERRHVQQEYLMNKVAIALALAVFMPLAISQAIPTGAQATEISSRAREHAYCLRGGTAGRTACLYNSRAQCVKSSRASGGTCVTNPRVNRG